MILPSDPRIIKAKYDSVCAETGKNIKAGEECVYQPTTKKVYSHDSTVAYDYSIWIMAITNEIN